MLMFSDLNLNQLEDSVRMSLKRTIIQHELIFKDQVHELHRLYWTQKNLMRELYRKEVEVKVLSQSRMVGSAKEGNVGSLEEAKGKFTDVSGNRHRGFIRNSAKISIVDEVIRPGYSGAKMAIDEKEGGVIDKGENLYCYEVIDLEGPADNGFKIPRANCGVMGSSRLDNVSDMASSSRIQNETGFVIDLNSVQSDCSEQWREHKADDHSGAVGSESSVAGGVDVSTSSSHKQEPNSSKPMFIDLNKPQDDEFSHAVNDPMITISSPSPSSSVIQNEALWIEQCNNINFKETSAALNSEVPHSASIGKSIYYSLPGCKDSPRSHVSAFGKQDDKVEGSESKGLTECCRKSAEGFPNIVVVDKNNIEAKLANNVTNENGPDENFLTERKSDDLSGNTACTSSEKIMEENSETIQLDNNSLVEEQVCRHDEEDHAVIDAADILAGISLIQPSSQLERFNKKKDQPEYSSDSFEIMTLELPEVKSHERHLLMPTRQSGNETDEETAASRVNNKLRRGRGRAVRDFQKDVLPGMVSLSRHEICEDMHSIGYDLRKNGLRRGNCFVPFKSGRSRRYPIRQRYRVVYKGFI